MKIKKFEEYVNELWSKGIHRSETGDIRKEDGTKVRTCIGEDIIISNVSYKYDDFISEIIDEIEGYTPAMSFESLSTYTDINRKEIETGKKPYDRKINNTIAASFYTYEELVDDDFINPDEINERDYNSIVDAITNAFRKTDVENLPSRHSTNVYRDEMSHNGCVFCLVDESDMNYYTIGHDIDDVMVDDFEECFGIEFGEKPIFYSWAGYSTSIGVSINMKNLLRFDEMKLFAHDFFKNQPKIDWKKCL